MRLKSYTINNFNLQRYIDCSFTVKHSRASVLKKLYRLRKKFCFVQKWSKQSDFFHEQSGSRSFCQEKRANMAPIYHPCAFSQFLRSTQTLYNKVSVTCTPYYSKSCSSRAFLATVMASSSMSSGISAGQLTFA